MTIITTDSSRPSSTHSTIVTENITKEKEEQRKAHGSNNAALELVKEGDAALESLDLLKASECYQSAVSKLSNNDNHIDLADALAKLGECKVSMGDQEGARDDFERAIHLINNDEGRKGPSTKLAEYYLYLGQLSLLEEALEAYTRGIEELQRCIQTANEEKEMNDIADDQQQQQISSKKQELQEQLARAHCTTAELYLTDLCYAENAEKECESHVENAMKATPEPIIDALQVMASLRLSQQKKEEAKTFMLRVYNSMKTGCEALATIVGLNNEPENEEEGALELKNVNAANNLPSFEFRCQSAKFLLECDCIEPTIIVLGSLLAENDEVVEIWYLLGCAFFEAPSSFATAEEKEELSLTYWERALEMLRKVEEGLQQEEEDDDDVIQQLNACQDQITDIENKIKRAKETATATSMDES
eukprot:CAMPEP_0194143756 /NCGR_PEP_ID=MMETSP0152-20130528/12863_1 /TAXON_ID=1049557 /ORGANISM="Thalassiothrix antarctica, Strain L6-D1" /LENGTH=418 /DNA_ID=CAMNT_0038843295 /DNA_START=9 /DNA_END=1268 /DNA_ORIENTATION=+